MPNFFWVNQGRTYDAERAAGLLWAPERSPTGSVLIHWETMTLVRPGDVIFTYSSSSLRGYTVATSSAVPMARPYAAGAAYSPGQGGRAVFCTYVPVAPWIPLATIQADPALVAALQAAPNPVLDVNGDVAQKYLCQIAPFAAAQLTALVGGPAAVPPPLAPTTVERLLDARVGQGQFRQDLMGIFGAACAITGLAHTALLRASHIKLWAVSTDQERLNPQNGLFLAAGVDAAFDKGFISFDDNGSLLVKQSLASNDRQALGIPVGSSILPPHIRTPARMTFLEWHRTNFQH